MIELKSRSRKETEALGERLGRLLRRGDVVTLSGPMGAGKTVLVMGIARALGCGENVSSPTFALAHEYPTEPPLVHMDAYRLENAEAFRAAGMEEYLAGDAVCLLEWPDVGIASLPASRLDILIRGSGEETRTLYLRPMGEDWTARLENFNEDSGL